MYVVMACCLKMESGIILKLNWLVLRRLDCFLDHVARGTNILFLACSLDLHVVCSSSQIRHSREDARSHRR